MNKVRYFLTAFAGLAGLLFALPLLAFIAWWGWAHFVESPRFAANYFDKKLEIEKVFASRRWLWGKHPWGGSHFGCTYAIAQISKTTNLDLPAKWKANWKETPVVVPDGKHDILKECYYLWGKDVRTRLFNAHDAAGSHYALNSDQLLLYSPKEGIAARVYFGD